MNASTAKRAEQRFKAKMQAYKSLTGYTNAEIAKQLGVCEATAAHAMTEPFKYRPSADIVLILLEAYEEEKKKKGIEAL